MVHRYTESLNTTEMRQGSRNRKRKKINRYMKVMTMVMVMALVSLGTVE